MNDFRIGVAALSLSTFIRTFRRVALAKRSPGSPWTDLTAGVSAATSVGKCPGSVVPSLTDLIVASTAPQELVAEHHNERRIQDLDGIFKASDHFVAREIAGNAAYENVAAGGVKAVFRRNTGIGAAQDRRKRVLTCA